MKWTAGASLLIAKNAGLCNHRDGRASVVAGSAGFATTRQTCRPSTSSSIAASRHSGPYDDEHWSVACHYPQQLVLCLRVRSIEICTAEESTGWIIYPFPFVHAVGLTALTDATRREVTGSGAPVRHVS